MSARVTIHHGDCLDVLRTVPDASLDSCVTDPPYALVSIAKRFGKDGAAACKTDGATGVYKRASAGFMGKKWDTGERAFAVEFWAEVLRVLKPGAHLLAFSGTRTYHRLACAVEDAGFEIRDQIGWLYGSGFPKSHNQHGQWEGWGTALKPAWEPIVMARKPLDGTVSGNLEKHSVGALNIAGCRIGSDERINGSASPTSMQRKSRVIAGYRHDEGIGSGAPATEVVGRWPANVIHDGSAEVMAAFPPSNGQQGAVTGDEPSRPAKNVYGEYKGRHAAEPRGDAGSAARFFYSAKADEADRCGSKHPTVKPIDLMAYLLRLVTPPGGRTLDPFAGSGSTGMAALREGFDAVLIEREAEYVADIRRRIDHVSGADTPLFGGSDQQVPPSAISDTGDPDYSTV